jgi:hypothetical protein
MNEHQGKRARRRTEMLRGSVIYALGDSVAAWIAGEFSLLRLVGMGLVGGAIYSYEIPHYFRWIEQRVATCRHPQITRTGLALLYFNPLWIARHLFFIKLFSGDWPGLSIRLVRVGFESFVFTIPLTFTANYLIQNKLPLAWRFTGSAVFSGLMAVYYALSESWLAS